jgi:hypothetical protein
VAFIIDSIEITIPHLAITICIIFVDVKTVTSVSIIPTGFLDSFLEAKPLFRKMAPLQRSTPCNICQIHLDWELFRFRIATIPNPIRRFTDRHFPKADSKRTGLYLGATIIRYQN